MPARPAPDGRWNDLRSGGVRLVALTNSGADAGTRTLEANGLLEHVDRVLGVDAVQTFKPDPAVYRYAVTELGIPAGRVALLATHPWDLAGAAHGGLRTAWVRHGERRVAERVPGARRGRGDAPRGGRAAERADLSGRCSVGGERGFPDRGAALVRTPRKDEQSDGEADPKMPVAHQKAVVSPVDGRGHGDAVHVGVGAGEGGRRVGEQGAQQRGPDRASDLLGGVHHR